MKRGQFSTIIGIALTAVCLTLLMPRGAEAQAKVRIAIWDFENHAERSWWFWDQLGPAARNYIDTAFSMDPECAARFSIIEREKLDLVLQEQGLSTSGALDQQTAAKVGKLLGIKYILTGAIDKFAINTTKGGFGGIGGSYTKAEATINMRFIDTTTGERIVALSADGDVKKGGGMFKGASLSRDAEWGIASEAVEKTAKAVVTEFAGGDYMKRFSTGGVAGGAEGKIIKVEGDKAWINMGSMSGLNVGDKYDIYNVGEALVDPDTGQVLGVNETKTGSGEVVEVKERFSILAFTGTAQAKDVVRKP
jgi:curli biogenesis system outer membrane secretion channel CsgG